MEEGAGKEKKLPNGSHLLNGRPLYLQQTLASASDSYKDWIL